MKAPKDFLFVVASCCLLLFYNCEKDDICVEGTPGTPRLVIDFYDFENPETVKAPSNLTISAVATNTSIIAGGGPYTLPLRNDQEFTQFTFTLNLGQENENHDLVQINYRREDLYINRACGYKAQYLLGTDAVVNSQDTDNWIKGYSIIETTVQDETVVHLALLH